MKNLNIFFILALCSLSYTLPHPPPIDGEDLPPDGTCNRDHQCPAADDGHIPCCSFYGKCSDSAEACEYGCQGGTNCKLIPTTAEEKVFLTCYTTWRDNKCDDYCFCREGTGSCINGYCVKDDEIREETGNTKEEESKISIDDKESSHSDKKETSTNNNKKSDDKDEKISSTIDSKTIDKQTTTTTSQNTSIDNNYINSKTNKTNTDNSGNVGHVNESKSSAKTIKIGFSFITSFIIFIFLN
ncbi:hypothetical protein BCR36DRAFT_415827 [Piromyces finnis]|uniref:Chitin-binding type-1 domain-containing protein n=1 Tax=Piromyces finnis TaxID=1754191 RepID=A0A1Y1UXM0_9FUNG|nr:hypothetical protein BCR36DRAFT_415827 [Piromyces finnis]|eukprot:ORX42980.1 hypothetical protein BCR36DRAFT_415827 [Piromyces finnis]